MEYESLESLLPHIPDPVCRALFKRSVSVGDRLREGQIKHEEASGENASYRNGINSYGLALARERMGNGLQKRLLSDMRDESETE